MAAFWHGAPAGLDGRARARYPRARVDVRRVLETSAWVAGGIVTYEIIRSMIVGYFARRLDREGQRYVRSRNIQLDRYKFASRSYVKHEVLLQPELQKAMDAQAKEQGRPLDRVRADVDDWLDEIIPSFNTWAFYRFGFVVARMALNFMFEVIIDRLSLERVQKKIPEGAAVVYVFNHRSNADFILASYALANSIAISYAVGEWARVWPLDALFRRFGAYFVRRGFRNPLYHRTLASYVQLIVKRGVTQGVFPEGGLTRDGGLREPKLGILEYVAALKGDPSFRGDVVFVPVGINYDRVLEDNSLLAEARGGGALGKDTIASRLATGWAILRKLPGTLLVNSIRAAAGRTGRYGYAAVAFGDPVSLSQWMSGLGVDVFALPPDDRREKIRQFATVLMAAIGELVPATPATVVADVIARSGAPDLSADVLRERLVDRLEELRRAGRRIAQGREFAAVQAGRLRLSEDLDRRPELLEEERALVAAEEAELTMRLGLEFLERRAAVRVHPRLSEPQKVDVRDPFMLRFYARSLDRSL